MFKAPLINAAANTSPSAHIRLNYGTPSGEALPSLTSSPMADALLRFGRAALMPAGRAETFEPSTYRLPNLIGRMNGSYGVGGEFYAKALGNVEAAQQLAAQSQAGLMAAVQGTGAAPYALPLYETLQDPRWGPEASNLRNALFHAS
jgi:hypothetical protein